MRNHSQCPLHHGYSHGELSGFHPHQAVGLTSLLPGSMTGRHATAGIPGGSRKPTVPFMDPGTHARILYF